MTLVIPWENASLWLKVVNARNKSMAHCFKNYQQKKKCMVISKRCWGGIAAAAAAAKSLQSCPTLSDPMDCSLPGSSVHRIFQARVLEWGAIAFSSGIRYYLTPSPSETLIKTGILKVSSTYKSPKGMCI